MKHLKQQLLMVLFVASGLMSFAQVGVGTTDPKASLDVSGDAATATSVDGIIAPRLTGDQLKAKDAVYTTNQNGAIVYVTAAVGTSTAKTINVTAAGYYYYDSTVPVWKSIGGGSASSAGLVANRVAISSITAGANGVYTVTDSNTPSAAGSPILATYEDAAGNVTSVNINNRTAGTSFDVTFAATPDAAGFLNYVFPTANVSVVTGATGPAGTAGAAATVAVGTVSTLAAGATPTVSNSGTTAAAVLDFGLAPAATVTVGTVSTLAAGATPTVSNSGTTAAAVLDFGFADTAPGLVANRVAISSITAGANGVYTVTDSNTPSAAGSPILATYEDAAGNVTSVNINNRTAGTSFDVTFAATPDAAGFLNYVFPTANVSVVTGLAGPTGPAGTNGTNGAPGAAGTNGAPGAAGAAATVAVGTVSTLAVGATPTVTNSGTTAAAVLDFGFAVASVLKGTQATDGTNAAFTISNTNISATSVVTVSYQNSSNEIINHAITAIAAGSFTVQFAATPASGGKILYTVVN